MYCTHCGENLNEAMNFCGKCGTAAKTASGSPPPPFNQTQAHYNQAPKEKRLLRPLNGNWLAGVCAAFARYLGVDLSLVRLLWVLAVICAGTGLVAYVVCWIIIPREEAGISGPAYSA